MDGNTELLNYIYQNAKMGMDTIGQLLGIVDDEEFKKQLLIQKTEYKEILDSAMKALNQEGHQEKDINAMSKIMAYLTINLKTLTDNSPSHIAEMLIQGSTMGTIDAEKNLKKYSDGNKDSLTLLKRLLKTEEQNIEKLKEFL